MVNLKTGKSFQDACDGIHAVDTPNSLTRRSALKGLAAILAAGVAPSLCGSITRGIGYRNLAGRMAAMCGGKNKKDVDDYAGFHDGYYVFMLDGIRNLGIENEHDNYSTTWRDVIDSIDIQTTRSETGREYFSSNSAIIDSSHAFILEYIPQSIASALMSKNATIEIVANKTVGGVNDAPLCIGNFSTRGMWAYSTYRTSFFQTVNCLTTTYTPTLSKSFGRINHPEYIAIRFMDENFSVSCNGNYGEGQYGTLDSISGRIGIGQVPGYNSIIGNIYAIRISNVVLTAEEETYNKTLDEERFGITF